MSNALAAVNHAGHAWTVQTESPRSANLYEARNFLPRSKKSGDSMAAAFGGTWRYVPGHGCRGGWSVEAESPEALREILNRTGIPITVYVYSGTQVPEAFADCPQYGLRGGFYRERMA